MSRRKFYPFICLVFLLSTLLSSCTPPLLYEPEPVVREDVAFSSLPFYLPELDEVKAVIHTFVEGMESAKSANEQIALMTDYDRETRRYADMRTISYIRFYQNTSEETRADFEYFTQLFADISQDENEANMAIVDSKYIKGLEAYFGKGTIDQIRNYVREYDPVYAELAAELSALQNEYVELTTTYLSSSIKFSNEADALLSEMLTLREKLAELAGYDSFSEYSYSKWSIGLSDVKTYIENVKQTVLPVYQRLADNGSQRQDHCPAARWIEPVHTESENDLYALSIQTLRSSLDEMNALIDYTERNEVIDVMRHAGKMQGAYTFALPGVQVPFVYADYPDPNAIIHEFGHALEVFTWPKIDLSERLATTPESMEVSSTCMEVLATAQYELLYGDTAEYARMAKTYELVYSLLEQAMQCEFELALYENPSMTKNERNTLFNELLEEYRIEPFSWTATHHFFTRPLYTVSYSIDYVAALDLLSILQDNPSRAKEVYMNYLRDCTQKDFTVRLKNAGFRNPLERQTLEELAQSLDVLFTSDEYLNPKQLKMAG